MFKKFNLKNINLNPFKETKANSERDVPSRVPTSQRSFMSWLENLGRNDLAKYVAMIYYLKCYPVSSAIEKNAEALSSIKPIYQDKDEQEIPNFDPLEGMRFQTDSIEDLIEQLEIFYDVTGEMYLEFEGVNNIFRVRVLRSQHMSTYYDDDDMPETFTYANYNKLETYSRDKDGRYFNAGGTKELVPKFKYNPESGSRGLSPLSGISPQIEEYMSTTSHNLATLNNQIKPSTAFIDKDQALSDEEREQFRQHLDEFYQGTGNAGSYLLMGGELDVKPLDQKKDMDYKDLQNSTRNAVFQKLGVPITLADTTSATFNNRQIDELSYYDNVIIPRFNLITGFIAEEISKRTNTEFFIGFNINSIPALAERELKNLERKAKIGHLSINELRDLDYREQVEGGNVIYKPANDVPVATDTYTEDEIEKAMGFMQKAKK